jgi:hypothetical protein
MESRVLLEKLIVAQLVEKSYAFMELEISFSVLLDTGLYPEPDESCLYPKNLHISFMFILILSPHLRLGFPSALFSSNFQA